MTSKWTPVCLRLLVLLALGTLWAQSGKNPKYDPAKEITVKGTVEQVRQIPEGNITELVIKTANNNVQVYLAPAEFLKEIECWIKQGDQVEVVGAKAADSDEVLAREVSFGNNTMTLRDPKGVPIWTAWKPSKSS